MKANNFFLVGATAAVIYFVGKKAYNVKEAVRKLIVRNQKIKIALNGLKVVLNISLEIFNPGSSDIPFQYLSGVVNYEGSKIADFNYNGQPIPLKARGVTPLNFNVEVSTAGILFKLGKLLKALKDKTSKVSTILAVQTTYAAAGIDVPYNFLYDLRKQEMIAGIGAINKIYYYFFDKYGKKYGFKNYNDFARFWFSISRNYAKTMFPDFVKLQQEAGAKNTVAGIGSLNTFGTYLFGDCRNVDDLDDLRKLFYKLSKKYHPDSGGTNAEFQLLQNEYEKLKYNLYNSKNFSKEEVDIEGEIDAVLTAIYHKIMHIEGIVIEVTGKWLWISGNTYPVKTQLKEAGLKFASTKKMWYFAGTEHSGKGKPLTMDNIRTKYGSQHLQTKGATYIRGFDNNLALLIEKLKFLLIRRKKNK